MLKMVFSLPVHEKAEVILDEVLNILYFNPDSAIILHLSPVFSQNTGWFTEKQFYKIISEIDNVYINSERIETGWRGTGVSGLVKVHISNFHYALTVIDDFEYFILEASNDLYIKNGLYKYISKYDYGQGKRLINKETDWIQGQRALQDKRLQLMLDDLGSKEIYGSQIEGTFFKKDIFLRVASEIEKYNDVAEPVKYAYEEIYFPTVVQGIIGSEDHIRCSKLVVKVFWEKKQLLLSIDDIDKLQNNKNIFAVKRIPRNYYFNTREYIRDKNNQYDVIENDIGEKILHVLNEEIWQEPYKPIWLLLQDGKYNEAIYSLLQLNDSYADYQINHSLASVILLANYIRFISIHKEYSFKNRILLECVYNILLSVAVSEDTILSAMIAADAIKYCVNNDIRISPKVTERVNTLLLQAVNKLEDDGDILGACYLLSVIKLVTSKESEIYHLASEIMFQQIGIS